MPRDPIVILLLLLVSLTWYGVMRLVALGGWKKLAERYTALSGPLMQPRRFLGARVGKSKYKGCLKASLEPNGLWLAVQWPWHAGHPELLIPWTDFHRREESFFGFTWPVYDIGSPTIVTFIPYGKLKRMIESSEHIVK